MQINQENWREGRNSLQDNCEKQITVVMRKEQKMHHKERTWVGIYKKLERIKRCRKKKSLKRLTEPRS